MRGLTIKFPKGETLQLYEIRRDVQPVPRTFPDAGKIVQFVASKEISYTFGSPNLMVTVKTTDEAMKNKIILFLEQYTPGGKQWRTKTVKKTKPRSKRKSTQ